MNLLLFPYQENHYTLSARDPRLEHVRGVLRMGVGDTFDVGAENGPRGKATIVAADGSAVELEVAWQETPQAPPPLDLLIALPRPATARKILTEATTLGVRSMHFFPAEKSDPAFARSRLWSGDGWRDALRLGAEQAFTTYLPPTGLHDDLETALAALPGGVESIRLAPDVYEATVALSAVEPADMHATTVLAIGPERGWGARDRTRLREAGFTFCSLGDRVLRVETATTVALTLLLAGLGRL